MHAAWEFEKGVLVFAVEVPVKRVIVCLVS